MTITDFTQERDSRKLRKRYQEYGWHIDDVQNLSEHQHQIYFYHADHNEIMTTAFNVTEAFESLFEEAQNHKEDLDNTLFYYAQKASLTDEEKTNFQNTLGLWVMTTETFQVNQTVFGIEHMASIVIYMVGVDGNTYLRPACVSLEQEPILTPEKLLHTVDAVLAIDKDKHPERFHCADIVPFKVE